MEQSQSNSLHTQSEHMASKNLSPVMKGTLKNCLNNIAIHELFNHPVQLQQDAFIPPGWAKTQEL